MLTVLLKRFRFLFTRLTHFSAVRTQTNRYGTGNWPWYWQFNCSSIGKVQKGGNRLRFRSVMFLLGHCCGVGSSHGCRSAKTCQRNVCPSLRSASLNPAASVPTNENYKSSLAMCCTLNCHISMFVWPIYLIKFEIIVVEDV